MPRRHPVDRPSLPLIPLRSFPMPSSRPSDALPDQGLRRGVLLIGWTLILVLCLIFYDALLISSLQREIRQSVLGTASMAASNLGARISTGVRMGKKLTSFQGLERLTHDAAVSFPEHAGIAVLTADGRAVHALGEVPDPFSDAVTGDGGLLIRETEKTIDVAAPIPDRKSSIAGYGVVRVPRDNLGQSLRPLIAGQVKGQLAASAAALLILIILLRVVPLVDANGGIRKKRLYAVCLGCFALVMAANAGLAVHTCATHYADTARANARRVGTLVEQDINRLLLVGVSLGQMDNMEEYLRKVSGTIGHAVVLEIRDRNGTRAAGSHPRGTEVEPSLSQSLPLHDPVGGISFSRLSPADSPDRREAAGNSSGGWSVGIEVSREAYAGALLATTLDVLTLVVVALIFLVEMFLLFFQYMDARRLGLTRRTLSHEQRSGLLRPLMFFFVLAMDMSISFIPLRMSELATGASPLSRDLLMGLPVSVEMGMTGLSVLLAGAWMKRQGIVPPMTAGMALMAMGYTGSMLSMTPLAFILARGVVGLGYGQCILAAQAYSVKDGKLSDMFAGVYAGSLCGSSLGAMLAERMGYSPVFMISALLFACLVALPALLFSERPASRAAGHEQKTIRPEEESGQTAPPRLTMAQLRSLLGNGEFLGLVFLSLMPGALLSISFLNYFLPVFLHSVDVSQSNIGRVFMLYCLILIYGGPWVGTLVHRTRRKALMIFWGGLTGALAILCFTVLPPLAASLTGALFLGAATCFNVPAQSGYLLQLDIAGAIGIDQTMGLLNALERLGQVVGPLCTGVFIAALGVADAALWAGFGYLAISLAFLLLARRGTSREAQTA